MAYEKVNWTNTPTTKINATNLNHMDSGIAANDVSINATNNQINALAAFPNQTYNLIPNHVNFTNASGWNTVNSGTLTASGALLTAVSESNLRIYADLEKSVPLNANASVLVKIRARCTSGGTATVKPCWRAGSSGVVIDKSYIIAGNVKTADMTWTVGSTFADLWLIAKDGTSQATIDRVGLQINSGTTVEIGHFECYFSQDSGLTNGEIEDLQADVNQSRVDIGNLQTDVNGTKDSAGLKTRMSAAEGNINYVKNADYYEDVNANIIEKAYGHGVYDSSVTPNTHTLEIKQNKYSGSYTVYDIPIKKYPFKIKINATVQGASTALIYACNDDESNNVKAMYGQGTTDYVEYTNYELEITNNNITRLVVTVRNDYPYEIKINDGRYANAYKSEHDTTQDARLDALEESKPWKGKKVTCLGDSTTYGDNGLGNGTASNTISWVAHLSALCGFDTVINKGMNGSHVAIRTGRTDSFVERVSQLTESDLFVVMGGLNDFLFGIPLGTLGNEDTSTFYGAFDYVISYILTNFPTSQLVVFTPMKVNHTKPSDGSSYGNTFSPNSQNLTEISYVNAVKEVCDKYSVRVKDLYAESGISPFNDAQKNAYMGDGLHYLDAGYERLARNVIAPFINSF